MNETLATLNVDFTGNATSVMAAGAQARTAMATTAAASTSAAAAASGGGGMFAALKNGANGMLAPIGISLSAILATKKAIESYADSDFAGAKEFSSTLTTAKGAAITLAQAVGESLAGGVAMTARAFTAIAEPVAQGVRWFTAIKNEAMEFGSVLGGNMLSAIGALLPAVTGTFSAALDWFSGLTSGTGDALGTVRDLWNTTWEGILDFVAPIWVEMVSIYNTAFEAVVGVVSVAYEAIADIVGTLVEYVSSTFGSGLGESTVNVVDLFYTMRDGVVNALMFVEFTIKNWRLVLDAALLTVAAGVVSFGNVVEHWFTKAVPAYIQWLAENWQNIFTDMFNFTTRFFTNLGTNLSEFFSHLPDLISGKLSLADVWKKGLLDGFESSLTALPTIAERAIGPLEAKLLKEAAAMNAEVAKEFKKFQGERSNDLARQVQDFKAAIAKDLPAFDPQIAANVGKARTPGKDPGLAALVEYGTREAYQATLKSLGLDRDNSIDKRQLDEQQKTNRELRTLNRKFDNIKAAPSI